MKKSIILAMVVVALACGPAWAYDEGPVMGPYTSIPGLTAIQQCQLTVAGKVSWTRPMEPYYRKITWS